MDDSSIIRSSDSHSNQTISFVGGIGPFELDNVINNHRKFLMAGMN